MTIPPPSKPTRAAIEGLQMADVVFLRDAARYFENRPTNGEHRAHWVNAYNASNCNRIAGLIERNLPARAASEEAGRG
jgi:hypothetical protein